MKLPPSESESAHYESETAQEGLKDREPDGAIWWGDLNLFVGSTIVPHSNESTTFFVEKIHQPTSL